MLQVGVIGYGTIGRDVAHAIVNGNAGDVKLKAILTRSAETIDKSIEECVFTNDSDHFFSQPLDLIIESAGHNAVQLYAERTLASGRDLIAVSVGAFADDELYEKVRAAAVNSGRKLILPSCAIAGLDRISAGSMGHLEQVKLCTRKPPSAWYGTVAEHQVDLNQVTVPVCIFQGSARESARLFPESVNVSAALSLAGIGFDRTQVEVYVDPSISQNTHEIIAYGEFGSLNVKVQNTQSASNPKTGSIVAMSVIRTLRALSTPFLFGL